MKKIKKINTLSAALLGVTLINPTIAATDVGATFFDYQDSFLSIMRNSLKEVAANNKGIRVLMENSRKSHEAQNSKIKLLMGNGVKSLAINLVDTQKGKSVVDMVRNKAIPIVFFNRYPGKKVIDGYANAFYVGADPKESGIIQGELIAKGWQAHPEWDLNQDGRLSYALLKGEIGHPDAEARTKYVAKTLKSKGIKAQRIFYDSADWNDHKAKKIMKKWLSSKRGNKIEIVIANNDGMALGAIEAMKKQGKILPTFGVDAVPSALKSIKEGSLQGTVLNDAKGQAEAVYFLSRNLAAKKNPTEGTNYTLVKKHLYVPYVAVDGDNVENFMD